MKSSNLSLLTPQPTTAAADSAWSYDSTLVGTKYYELSNHLGNVLTVFRDVVNSDAQSGYTVDVSSVADYSPFGVQLDGRTQSAESYRYGFNGMEADDEVSGEGNSYTAQFWEYSPRIARRWNQDPIVKPYKSPYSCFSDNPITFVDPRGDDEYFNHKGQYLGSDDAKTTTARLIKQSDWDAAVNAIPKDDNPFNNDSPKAALTAPKSKVINFQSLEAQEKVMQAMEAKTATDGKETKGRIVLDIVSATVYLEEDLKATRSENHVTGSDFTYKLDDPSTHYVDGSNFTKVILAGAHTHPQTPDKNYYGPSTPENAHDPRYVDTNSSQKSKTDEYVLDKGLYKATPEGTTEELDRGTTNISKSSLKTYSSTHPAP
ncbi:MAG: hypothetical protein KJ941_05395 [Bacteroidetes bacterium]|nr:hypothetical protein [Bacteroidota bacterium]